MKLKLLMLISVFAFASCKKDKTVSEPAKTYAEENPLELYISNAGATNTVTFTNPNYVEMGLVFSPNVTGKIKAFTIKLPSPTNNLRVTLWDYDTKTVLKTELINVTAGNILTTKSIADFSLQKGKKYLLSTNVIDVYLHGKAGNLDIIYPIVSGNINFLSFNGVNGTTQTFPSTLISGYYAGDLSFVFQQTE